MINPRIYRRLSVIERFTDFSTYEKKLYIYDVFKISEVLVGIQPLIVLVTL